MAGDIPPIREAPRDTGFREQHRVCRAFRPERARRRRPGHGPQGPRLCRPHVLRRVYRHRCARPAAADPGQFCPGAGQFARLSPADPRRPLTDGQFAEHLGVAGLFGPQRLLQGVDHRDLYPSRQAVHRRAAGLRHFPAGRAARDRVYAGRRAGAASPVVCRRLLRLCVLPLAGVYRPRAGDHRHG